MRILLRKRGSPSTILGAKTQNGAGFTMLELVVVLGIITILLAIVVTGLNLSLERARDNRRVNNLREVRLSLEQYRSVCKSYPATLDPGETCGTLAGFGDFLVHSTLPLNPGNEAFSYVSLANSIRSEKCVGYHIGIKMEGGSFDELDLDDDLDSGSDTSPWGSNITVCDDSPMNGLDGADPMYDFKN